MRKYLPPDFDKIEVEKLRDTVKRTYFAVFEYAMHGEGLNLNEAQEVVLRVSTALRNHNVVPRPMVTAVKVAALCDVIPRNTPKKGLQALLDPVRLVPKADFLAAMEQIDPGFNELGHHIEVNEDVLDECEYIDIN